jgi:hypothetical protein
MKDASLKLTKALPNAGASNQTGTLDLNVLAPNSNQWRSGYLLITVPALADHTDSAKTNTLTLQDSADDNSYADTAPAVVAKIAGVASTGSPAKTFRVPLPPDVRRYLQFNQSIPTGGGTGSNAVLTYELVV